MRRVVRYSIFIVVGLLVVIIGGIVLAAIFHDLPEVLYIFLMVLAVLMVGVTIFQGYAILMLVRAIGTVQDEVKPLLASVEQTVGIVRDTAKTAGRTASTVSATTKFASEFALSPSVHATAALVAAQQMLRVFLGRGQVRTRAEERRKQQMEAAMEAATGGGE